MKPVIWTNAVLKKEAKKFKTLKEFRNKSFVAYTLINRKGLKHLFNHLIIEKRTYTKKQLIKLIKKHNDYY